MAAFPRKAPTPPHEQAALTKVSWLQPADMIFQPPGPPGGYFQYNLAPLFAPSASSSSPSPSLPVPHRASAGSPSPGPMSTPTSSPAAPGPHHQSSHSQSQSQCQAPVLRSSPPAVSTATAAAAAAARASPSACGALGSGLAGAGVGHHYSHSRSPPASHVGPSDLEATNPALPSNVCGFQGSSPTFYAGVDPPGASPSSTAAATPTPLGSSGVRTHQGFGQGFVDTFGGDQSSPTYSPARDRLNRTQESIPSGCVAFESPAQRGPFPKARQPARPAKQEVPDEEMEYLKRNVDHLRNQKRRLEDRVQSLEARVQGLEEQKEQYRMLYEQSQHQAMAAGGGEREIHCLREQLYAVTYLKDALNKENDDLLKRLENAHGEESKQGACVICMDNLANLVCFPCKHLAICAFCDQRENIVHCPICRGPAERKEQIYMP